MADGQENPDPLGVSEVDFNLSQRFDGQIYIITTGKQDMLWKVYTNDEAHPQLMRIY